ncbi:MAG: hypothetical protein PHI24_11985 [Desulfitobacteriaceae bacterium]|nr:hypothetical protein [Desulfitobacteriaceae bacterium]
MPPEMLIPIPLDEQLLNEIKNEPRYINRWSGIGLPQFVWEAITNKTIFATSRKWSKPDSVTICPGTGTGLIDTLQKISCQQLDLLDAWAKDGHQRLSRNIT